MTVYRIPEQVRTLIFDIDSTLYTNEAYAFEQVDVQIRQYALEQGMSVDAARRQVNSYRENWKREHGGCVSLGNTLKALGVPIAKSIEWRRKLLEPARFLCADSQLQLALSKMAERFCLMCVTNNPVLPAQKTLAALGVERFISGIIGLDTCGVSKPHRRPFELACELSHTDAEHCVAIGDRYDLDVALPLEMGMGGILVSGAADVYVLPALFFSAGA